MIGRWITRLRINQLKKAVPLIEARYKLAAKNGRTEHAARMLNELYHARLKITALQAKLDGWP